MGSCISILTKIRRMKLLLVALFVFTQVFEGESFCIHAGGIGEYSRQCPDSADFDACFARCQCYDGDGNPTHQMDALCPIDTCFCVFNSCPYGRLITEPLCCTKGGGATITCQNYCDHYP